MKTTEILLNYIRDNPGCVSSDIYEALKKVEESKNISSLLSDLTKRKVVYREEFYGDGNRKMFKYWIAGAEIGTDIVRLDPYDFDKAVAAKENESTRKKVDAGKQKEVYFVFADDHLADQLDMYDEACRSAKNICETSNYNSVMVVKVVKTFKRVVTIVEE